MKDKKKWLIPVIIGVSLIVLAVCIWGVTALVKHLTSMDEGGSSTIKLDSKEKVNVVEAKTKTIEYEKYDNSLVSLDIPKGWQVTVAPVDYIHYSFKVYDPENPEYLFLFGLKQEGFLKSELARSTYASMYPDAVFSKLKAIDPQTTEAFYKVWNDNARLSNETELKTSYFPYYNDFSVIENLGQSPLGGDILRASFKNDEGKDMQGLFTANVMSIGTYMISQNMWNPFGPQVDVSPLNVYNIVNMVAPNDDFINWESIYNHCLGSIEFSQTFKNGFNSEETTLVNTIIANQKIYDSISDMIMDSWEKRNNSYDIISQKQSDAILGYERVYDTETGDIYKAYNGFTDDYSGDRYQPITDNMYTEAISGYIEK